jgi:hypothetical protein
MKRGREKERKEEIKNEIKKYPICSDELSEWKVIILFALFHINNGKETARDGPTFYEWKRITECHAVSKGTKFY